MQIDRHDAKQVQQDMEQMAKGAVNATLIILKRLRSLIQRLKTNNIQVKVEPEQVKPQQLEVYVDKEVTPKSLEQGEGKLTLTPEVVTAKTATQLLQHYGEQEGQERVYEAQDYSIRSNETDTTIRDRDGQLLMRFKEGVEPDIQEHNIDPKIAKDFGRVHEQLQQHGIAQEPDARLRQYQNLAPARDVTLAQDLRNLAAVIVAQRVLDTAGKDTYETDQFQLNRVGENITIQAKDGRGDIAQIQDGGVTGKLSANDVIQLNQLERDVVRPESEAKAQNYNLTPLEAVVYDRLISTNSYSPEDAKTLAEQAVKPSVAADPELKEMVFSKKASELIGDPDSRTKPPAKSQQLATVNNEASQESEIGD